VDVTQLLSSYSIAIQQMVAIARVLDVSSKILILDEAEVEQLFKVIRKLRDDGLAILDQTYRISNRITILKNGEFVGERSCRSSASPWSARIGRGKGLRPARTRKPCSPSRTWA
jgi:ABC-type sugar transport system ATPase subunit